MLAGGKAGPILAMRECCCYCVGTATCWRKSEDTLPRQVSKQPPALEPLGGTERKLSTGVFVPFSRWSPTFISHVFLLTKITRGDRKKPVGPWPASEPQESLSRTPG